MLGRAAVLAAGLSDEDLVGQVLMPYAHGGDAGTVSAAAAAANRRLAGVDTPAQLVEEYRPGGMILVGFSADDPTAATNPTTNVDSPEQVRRLTTGLQSAASTLPAGVPLLIGTDQEYGTVTRIRSGIVQLPSALALGAAADPELTRRAWAAAGAELAALGLTAVFAPVADVIADGPGGPIGSRSYGSDPTAVAAQVAAAVRGLHAAGLAATLKHFPGHGHTTGDSHAVVPVLAQSRAELDAGDLPPFRAGIAAGADLVMSGHLRVRAIDPTVPATFSAAVLTELLRGQLGFTGVAITDALRMAPAQRWPPGEAAVRALLAGNDLLLQPPDLAAARRGLLDALRSGKLPAERLIEAATRVLALKLRLAGGGISGSPSRIPTRSEPPMSAVDSGEHHVAARRVAAAAMTLLRGQCGVPLVSGPVRVTTSAGRDRQRAWLARALEAEGMTVVESGGTGVHLVGYGDTEPDLSRDAAVTVGMDLPYLLEKATSETLVATYSSSLASMEALAAVLAGRAAAPGHSPVRLAELPRSAC
nr:glycoside hydrolase family 3 N-terminal domain-containing protein [Rugosimonospora africana]